MIHVERQRKTMEMNELGLGSMRRRTVQEMGSLTGRGIEPHSDTTMGPLIADIFTRNVAN